MKDRFEKSCFDCYVIHSTTQCDRLNCEVIHNPAFDILFNEANNEYCYCLDRQQLDQYWQCIVQNHNLLCPRKCDRSNACKEVSLNFTNLQKSYFFYPNIKLDEAEKPFQPVKWRIFTATNKTEFRIEIAQSIPHIGLVLKNGQTC